MEQWVLALRTEISLSQMSLSHPDQQSLRGIEDSDLREYDLSCALKLHSISWEMPDGYTLKTLKRPVLVWHGAKDGPVGDISREGAGQN